MNEVKKFPENKPIHEKQYLVIWYIKKLYNKLFFFNKKIRIFEKKYYVKKLLS